MAVRIRVYPQTGALMGGAYGYGGYAQLANVKLQNERQTSNLRLQYERALWQEKMKTVQLQTALQYGGSTGGPTMLGGFGNSLFGAGMLGGLLPSLALGMVPRMMGGTGGQINVTNQTGAGTQTVTNTNSVHSAARPHAPFFGGWGRPAYGGGFFSSLLGALI